MSSHTAIEFHNQIAPQFAQKYESSAAFGERFRIWTSLFSRYVKPTDCVLDLGCGPGVFSQYLAQKGCQVLGIDGSKAMIDLCNKNKMTTNVRYLQQSLPLADPSPYHHQDVVVMSSLLEYMEDTEQMLQQINNWLKPNGLLIVSMPNALSLYRRAERIFFWLTGYPKYCTYTHNRSGEVLFSQHITSKGFNVLETVYFSNHDPISRVLKSWLSRQYTNNLFVMVCQKRDY